MIDDGRPFGTVTRHEIVGSAGCAHISHGAHRDHIRIVARRGNGAVAVRPLRIVAAVVARRDHHHDTRFPGRLHRLAKGILGVALIHRAPQRQVHDPDVVSGLQSDRRIDRGNHVGVGAVASLIQYPKVDDFRPRCEALEVAYRAVALRGSAVPGDDARYMCSVPISVLSRIA